MTSDPESSQEESSQEESSQELTVDAALAEWRELADAKSAAETTYEERIAPAKEEYEQQTGPIDDRMAELEKWFLVQAETSGQDGFQSDVGAVTVSTRDSPKITDAETFFTWAATSNNVGLLQKRISVTEYRAFTKDNPDEQPPGVTVEYTKSAKFKPAKT